MTFNNLPNELIQIIVDWMDFKTLVNFIPTCLYGYNLYYFQPNLFKEKYIQQFDIPQDALFNACEKNHINIVRELIGDTRIDPSAQHHKAIQIASKYGHNTIVLEILKDDRSDSVSALWSATRDRNLALVQELLKYPQINPSINDNHVFFTAIINGFTEIVHEFLKDSRVDTDDDLLCTACEGGHLEIVQELLKDSRINPWTDIYDPNAHTDNPILLASQRGFPQIVQELLKDNRIKQHLKNLYPRELQTILGCLVCQDKNKDELISSIYQYIN